jgi:hypothetical protein
MDKRLAQLIIAAAVTMVGVTWAAAAGAQADEFPRTSGGFGEPRRAALFRDGLPARRSSANSKAISSVGRRTALGERDHSSPRQGSYASPVLQRIVR